jgi:predicted site-specific integrase-resolvase
MSVQSLEKSVEQSLVKAAVIAKLYDVTPSLIYKWARDGKIPCVRFSGTTRFNLDAVCNVVGNGKGQAL